ncbi:bifunctional cytidylate kinase/GTPase Der [Actinomyces sp. zg-332]|uniref:bifunctional cytidylate kinase/GTPase Der n=1 Tax=Actinomyces sp. zg-332 TaxID=2708340 RepID=UPI001421178F|nr:bifunctional cytidylate kinase/GTPase Der [Actinomyces sp. zg-332]QPK94688.1 bifunctional cytidylate kinase/GTPase Der [Actinomyces sp. zg-332]
MKNIVVAIDGPSGSGKSSVSKQVAKTLNMAYLDTGATYRAATWWCLQNDIDFTNEEVVVSTIESMPLEMPLDPSVQKIICADTDITEIIRTDEITSKVSKVSTILKAREVLVQLQKQIIEDVLLEKSIIVEGRDITTVVYPQADIKLLITADERTRVIRRAKELYGDEYEKHIDTTFENSIGRDKKDSVVVEFMKASEGTTLVDTTLLDFDETVQTVLDMVEETIRDIQLESMLRESLNEYDLEDTDYSLLNDEEFWEEDYQDTQALPVLAIIGRPNVGKSTLVNRILGRREAVVQDKPGVTRDRVSYPAQWGRREFTLVDTGGWEVDVAGIDKAVASQAELAVQMADAVVFVVDATVGATASDERIVQMLRRSKKPVILAANKVDSQMQEADVAMLWSLGLGEPHPISALHGRGSGDLLDAAMEILPEVSSVAVPLPKDGPRRIALIGRPNVGKSSLLNTLAGQERVVVHDMDGTTRDPVDEMITLDDRNWWFVDTAGIRRRVHKTYGADYYASIRTAQALEKAELALVLFDASSPLAEQDVRVVQQAVDAGRALVIINNKWDLVDEERQKFLKYEQEKDLVQISWAPRVNISAKTGWHTNRLVRAIDQALDGWETRISTSKLNSFLGELVAEHPHPVRGGKQPRILFATQASAKPPRFVIFTTGFLDPGYRRFIERRLRETFGFVGTPIQISVRVREKRKRK